MILPPSYSACRPMARRPGHHGRYRCCSCFLVLLCLVPASSEAQGRPKYWAIDCGAARPFNSTGDITWRWEADGSYVHGGVSRNVSNPPDETFRTLRAFEDERPAKGCYTVPVDKGTKVQASAWFYYGNYDGKGQPPAFLFQFDDNEWDIIETSLDGWTSRRVVYVARANATSICVARGRTNQTPFISTLHVVVLDKAMYSAADSSRALRTLSRVAFGANRTIRDDYFRHWADTTSTLNISDYTLLGNETTVDTVNLTNKVPPTVFQTAISPAAESANITIVTPFLLSTSTPVYFIMYFTEPKAAEPDRGVRSFRILMDGQPLRVGANGSDVVIPPHGSAIGYDFQGYNASNATVFKLVPTEKAISPVISAWELFAIMDLVGDGTNSSDVNGLAELQERFKPLKAWAGDPCLPRNFSWEWAKCSSGASPRITEVNLSGYGLSGELPSFSRLDALETIDLSNNRLTGEVPAFLAELPRLKKLNLADNHFTNINSTLFQERGIQLNVKGNPVLRCEGRACGQLDLQHNSSVKKNGLGIIVALLFVCIIQIFTAVAVT